jgi:hypothetical protein
MIYFFLFFGSFSLINGLLIIISNSYNAWIDRNIKIPATAVKPVWMRSADYWITKNGMTDTFVRYKTGITFTVIGLLLIGLYFLSIFS